MKITDVQKPVLLQPEVHKSRLYTGLDIDHLALIDIAHMAGETGPLDVQLLLGHSTPAMVRRYAATYDAEKAARAHARWSPGDRLGMGRAS